jgi:hypothetical protein
MDSRREGSARRKRKALGNFISGRLAHLHRLARHLNGEVPANSGEGGVGRDRALLESVAAILEATWGADYRDLPATAVGRFNALAREAPVRFQAGPPAGWGRDELALAISDQGMFAGPELTLLAPTAAGIWVAWLVEYFDNPQRNRLKRCARCRQWFVDETRNASALRCSRACTIAWSNAQRPRKNVPGNVPAATRSRPISGQHQPTRKRKTRR